MIDIPNQTYSLLNPPPSYLNMGSYLAHQSRRNGTRITPEGQEILVNNSESLSDKTRGLIGQNTPYLSRAVEKDYTSRSSAKSGWPSAPLQMDEEGNFILPDSMSEEARAEVLDGIDIFTNQIPEAQEELSGQPVNMSFSLGGHQWDRNEGGIEFSLDEALLGVSEMPELSQGANVRVAVTQELDDWMLRHDSWQALNSVYRDVTLSALPDDQRQLVITHVLTITLAGADKGGDRLGHAIVDTPDNLENIIAKATSEFDVTTEGRSLRDLTQGVTRGMSVTDMADRIALNINNGQELPGLSEALETGYTQAVESAAAISDAGGNSTTASYILLPEIDAQIQDLPPETPLSEAIPLAVKKAQQENPDDPIWTGINWPWQSMATLVSTIGKAGSGIVDWIKETEGYARWEDLVSRYKEVETEQMFPPEARRVSMIDTRGSLRLQRSEFDVIMTRGMNKYTKGFNFESLEHVQATISHVLDNPQEYDVATQKALLMTYNQLWDTFKDRINEGRKLTDRDIKFQRLLFNFGEWTGGRTAGESTDGTDMFSFLFNPDTSIRKAIAEGDDRYIDLWAQAYDHAASIYQEEVNALLPPLGENASKEDIESRKEILDSHKVWGFLPTPATDFKHSMELFETMSPIQKVASIRAMHRMRTANPGGNNQAYNDIVGAVKKDFALITSELFSDANANPEHLLRAGSAIAVVGQLTDASEDYSDIYWSSELARILDLTPQQLAMMQANINLLDRPEVATALQSFALNPTVENAAAIGRDFTQINWQLINGLQQALAGTLRVDSLNTSERANLFSLGFNPHGKDESWGSWMTRLDTTIAEDLAVGYAGTEDKKTSQLLTSRLRSMGVEIANPFEVALTEGQRKQMIEGYKVLQSRGWLSSADLADYIRDEGLSKTLTEVLQGGGKVGDSDVDEFLFAAVTDGFMNFYRYGGEDMVEIVGSSLAGMSTGVAPFVHMGAAADLPGSNPHGMWKDHSGNAWALPSGMPSNIAQEMREDPAKHRNVESLATYTYANTTFNMSFIQDATMQDEARKIVTAMGAADNRNSMRSGLNVTDEMLYNEVLATMRDFKTAHQNRVYQIRVTPASIAVNAIMRLHSQDSNYIRRQGSSENSRFGMMGDHTMGVAEVNKDYRDLGLQLYSVGMELQADLNPALRSQGTLPPTPRVRVGLITKGPNNEPRHFAHFGNMTFEWDANPFGTFGERAGTPSASHRWQHDEFTAENGFVPGTAYKDPNLQRAWIEQQLIERGEGRADMGGTIVRDPISPSRVPGGSIIKPQQ